MSLDVIVFLVLLIAGVILYIVSKVIRKRMK